MSTLISPRGRGTHTHTPLIAIGVLATVALSVFSSLWSSARPAFADVQKLEIRSSSVVGAPAGSSLAPAVRLDPPTPAAIALPDVVEPAVVTPVVNRSTCRSDLAGASMTITAPDISYSCPVYAGGQKMLNSGAVTQISDPAIASVLGAHPGGPGVLWFAAHRSSHGGAFAAVPSLADGALITVSDASHTATYRVVGRAYVAIRNDRVVDDFGNATGAATLDSIIRPDHGGLGASRLLLQTCDGDDHRWMIYADLVTD
jgi:sortase (surface protein transpeptidase)